MSVDPVANSQGNMLPWLTNWDLVCCVRLGIGSRRCTETSNPARTTRALSANAFRVCRHPIFPKCATKVLQLDRAAGAIPLLFDGRCEMHHSPFRSQGLPIGVKMPSVRTGICLLPFEFFQSNVRQ